MNIGEAVYTETEYLQSLVPFDRISDVAASLGRIEVAHQKEYAEWQEGDDRLRRMHEEHLTEYAKRIAELESAFATLMDEYLCQNGFDAHYDAAAAVALNPRINLVVNSYDFNRNVFSATTDDGEVVEFDPFVGCAIELTDEEYYKQELASTIIGHKFAVNSLAPLPGELVSTTWKRRRAE